MRLQHCAQPQRDLLGCESSLLQGINKKKRAEVKRMGTEDLTESLVLAKQQASENTAGCDLRHSKQMSRLHQGVFTGQECWHGKKPRSVGRQQW